MYITTTKFMTIIIFQIDIDQAQLLTILLTNQKITEKKQIKFHVINKKGCAYHKHKIRIIRPVKGHKIN